MALIKCEECNNEVSDKAATCPKCGAPILNITNNVTDDGRIRVVTTEEADAEQDAEVSLVLWGVVILVGIVAWVGSQLFGVWGALIGGILSFSACLIKKSIRSRFLEGIIFKIIPLIIVIVLIVWAFSSVFK